MVNIMDIPKDFFGRTPKIGDKIIRQSTNTHKNLAYAWVVDFKNQFGYLSVVTVNNENFIKTYNEGNHYHGSITRSSFIIIESEGVKFIE